MIKGHTVKSSNLLFAYRPPYGDHYLTDQQNIEKMGQANINTVCFFASNTYSRVGIPYSPYSLIWMHEHEYNFEPLDKQIADLVELNPNINLICMVDLNSPLWLARLLRHDSYDELGNCAVDLTWRELTFDYLRKFLTYMEEQYADKTIAYVLACGKTAEWFDMRQEGDDARDDAFIEWCETRNITHPQRIPSRKRRLQQASHGLIRDPKSNAEVIAYLRFANEQVASLASDMIVEARKHIREEVQIGLFISAGLSGNPIHVGRNEFLKVFDTDGMNFSIAAGAATARLRTEGYGLLDPQLSLKLRNMHHLVEIDQRTHTSNLKASKFVTLPSVYSKGWQTEALTIAGLKREMSLCLINRTSLWFFNLFGGAYQGDKVWDTFALMKRIWDAHIDLITEERAEILLVVDPESNYYAVKENLAAKDGELKTVNLFDIRNRLNLVGAPYQSCCFDDLETMETLSPYKLVIFANLLFVTNKRIEIMKDKVFKDNRTILWQYAPGIIRNNIYEIDNVERLCGFPFGEGKLRVKRHSDWVSAYMFNPATLTLLMLKGLMEDAAIHMYVPLSVGIQANSRFLMVHSDEAQGKIPVRLPICAKQVTELFSGTIVAENTEMWEEDISAPDTRLFSIEWT